MSHEATLPGASPLLPLHREAGAVLQNLGGLPIPRHFGNPTEEYRAAVESGAVFDRSHRALLLVKGRSPGRMLTGIVSGAMPPEPEGVESGIRRGGATYSAVLTPKGKVVTDLRLIRLAAGEEGSFLLDVPPGGVEGLLEHLKRYLPPRFAVLSNPPEPLGLLTVTGREASVILSREALGLRVGAEDLEGLAEGEERILDDGGAVGIRVIRNMDVHPAAFDVLAGATTIAALWRRLGELGFAPAGSGVWETLRIEKGRPAFGAELDRDTLLPEAGLAERAVDHRKGCYTGQEVIVRIRDRGRVNRRLRGLFLGDLPTPSRGTPLFMEGREREAGEIRSSAQSPRFGQGIALGYVRREAEPPTTVRLGARDGPEVAVRELSDEGWVLVNGDPGLD
jgi:tRNA-modifying protein YgfZ